MGYQKVVSYSYGWMFKYNYGRLCLTLEDGRNYWNHGLDAALLAGLADLLRNEGPAYYDPDTKLLTTSREAPGEGEQ